MTIMYDCTSRVSGRKNKSWSVSIVGTNRCLSVFAPDPEHALKVAQMKLNDEGNGQQVLAVTNVEPTEPTESADKKAIPVDMDLSKLPKEKLLAELKRRQDEEKQAELKRRSHIDALNYANIEHLLAIAQHERTSCSDADPSNSGTNSSGYPSCTRCFLLKQKLYGYWADSDVELKITLEPRRNID